MTTEPPDTLPDTPPDITLVTGTAPPNPDGEWMTISEAVAKTGKSERTVRRWVDENVVEHKRQAGRVVVWIPAPATAPAITVTQQIELAERQAELLERLTRQQAHLAMEQAERQAAPLRETIREQATTIQEQAEEIGRLREVERELLAELERTTTPDIAPDTRSWWRRWFGP